MASVGGVFPPSKTPEAQQTPHVVTLTWNPSIPLSLEMGDTIAGYNVYRCSPGTPWVKLNSEPIPDTYYTDAGIQGGKTYLYATKSVNVRGTESKPSNVIRVLIPSP